MKNLKQTNKLQAYNKIIQGKYQEDKVEKVGECFEEQVAVSEHVIKRNQTSLNDKVLYLPHIVK